MSDDERAAVEWQLDALSEIYDRLSAWECQFVDSVRDQFALRGSLSPAQADKLEEIYTRTA